MLFWRVCRPLKSQVWGLYKTMGLTLTVPGINSISIIIMFCWLLRNPSTVVESKKTVFLLFSPITRFLKVHNSGLHVTVWWPHKCRWDSVLPEFPYHSTTQSAALFLCVSYWFHCIYFRRKKDVRNAKGKNRIHKCVTVELTPLSAFLKSRSLLLTDHGLEHET